VIVIYENNELYSAASAAGCMFYSVSRVEAERQLIEAGIDAECLDSPVDGVTWRSTLTSAMVNEIAALDAAIGMMAQVEDVADLRERLDILHDRQTDLNRQMRQTDIRQEIARCENILWQQELPQLMHAVGKRADEYQCVLILKRTSPTAKRIEALRAEWESLI